MSTWAGYRRRLRGAIVPADLAPREGRLLRLHLISALLTGTTIGTLHISDAVLVKTLGGSAIEITILSLMTGVAFLAALFWGAGMRHRRKAPFILAAALGGRLGLGLIGIWPETHWFILIYGLSWLAQGLIVTAQTSIIQQAYPPEQRGRLFGLAISATTLVRLLTTVATGWLLDWREDSYGWIYAATGLCGFVGAWFLVRMERLIALSGTAADATDESHLRLDRFAAGDPAQSPYRPLGQPGIAAGLRSMRESAALVARILREDHRYRRFQRNFFIYGVAFLSLLPVVPLFLVHDLGLDYKQIGLAKGLMSQAGMLFFPPLLGRWLERLKPVRFCTRIFAFLGLFPGLLAAATVAPEVLRVPVVYAAFVAWGIAMSGVALAWHLSSIDFSGREDSSSYQAVHLVLTGVRGGLAPLLGYGMIRLGSNLYGFLLSLFLFSTAAVLMGRMAREDAAAAPPGAACPDAESQD